MPSDLVPYDPLSLGDEQSKAVQRAAELGIRIVDAGKALGAYLGKALGTSPSDLFGVLVGSHLHFVHKLLIAKYDELLETRLKARGVMDTQPISPAIAEPMFSAAFAESRDELQELWANLIASAMDPKRRDRVRADFIAALKQMEPLDARVLQELRNQPAMSPTRRDFLATAFRVSPDEIEISFSNLARLGCINTDNVSPAFLPFGRRFLIAVDPN